MKVGFTGTRYGTTPIQAAKLFANLPQDVSEFHHGGCVGADTEVAKLVQAFRRKTVIVRHPADIKGMRDKHAPFDIDNKPKRPLDRNHDIVDACDLLLAAPYSGAEEVRSGTWATIRYARKVGKPHMIFFGNGDVFDSQRKIPDAKPKRRKR